MVHNHRHHHRTAAVATNISFSRSRWRGEETVIELAAATDGVGGGSVTGTGRQSAASEIEEIHPICSGRLVGSWRATKRHLDADAW